MKYVLAQYPTIVEMTAKMTQRSAFGISSELVTATCTYIYALGKFEEDEHEGNK